MSWQDDIKRFQRDLEIMEIESRKRLYSSRLYKWLENREKMKRAKRKKNG